MYKVKYSENNFVSNTQPVDLMSPGEAEKKGASLEFKTLRDAEKARTARANFIGNKATDYKIEKVEMSRVTTEELVDNFLAAVTAEYKNDHPTPGLVLSRLPSGLVYASVARYNQPGTYSKAEKVIVAKSEHKTVRGAIIDLGQTWLSKNIAKDRLAQSLKGA